MTPEEYAMEDGVELSSLIAKRGVSVREVTGCESAARFDLT
jgi:hypothetical protein